MVRSVGTQIGCRCPHCDRRTRHLVLAVDGDHPSRVRCRGCGRERERVSGSVSNAVAESTANTRAVPSHQRRVPDAVEQEWHDRVAAAGPDTAVPYRADRCYDVGALVDHPTLGLGLVRRILPPRTAEIHFQQGFKKLRCRTSARTG